MKDLIIHYQTSNTITYLPRSCKYILAADKIQEPSFKGLWLYDRYPKAYQSSLH